ncbi:MAG TPA: carboxypeptidase-like regulatory domain-containing protein, partial [Lentimicrobium sp.]|nr:carboxypeptidase-like regulatory domain-containing protein [Lentimicrobium sp.]
MKTRFIHHLLLAGLLLISGVIQSQPVSGVVKGRVIDTKNQPVAFATAALLTPQTTQIAKGVMCNEKGEFLIDKTEPGEYILSVRMLGFNANESEHIEITRSLNIIEKVIILTETVQQLQETVIAGKYDFVEQAVDKTIINPNASIISSSESIYEILKKTP